MELINVRVDDQMSHFYWEACRGDAETLEQLLQRDVTILANIPDGRQTPLHISALLGHVSFTAVLLNRHGDIAIRKDSSGRTALHLASAEGHIDIVKALLQANNEPCLNRDEEGRIPLHYAAMRGRTEVVQELIMARPDSLSLGDREECTVFHLCVTYNHLKTLETLVKLDYATANITAGQPRPPIFTRPDRDGDTILHLAITLKRVEVICYLQSIPEIRNIINLENNMNFTAYDILEQSQRDLKICEIQHILTKVKREEFETDHPLLPPPTSIDMVPSQNDGGCIKMFKCIGAFFMKIFRWIGEWSKRGDGWLEVMRGNLSLVSTVIATITFQALINPPGGFIQQGLVSKELFNCTTLDDQEYCPGKAMASSSHLHDDFKTYLFFVTLSFFSSLSVTLLLVSGIFPMKNKVVMWMASIGMCITLTSLAQAYFAAINIILPDYLLKKGDLMSTVRKLVLYVVWAGLLELIVILITLRFSIWVLKKCVTMIKKSTSRGRKSGLCRFLSVFFRIFVIFLMFVICCVQLLILGLGFMIYGSLLNFY